MRSGDWYYGDVAYVYARGILVGVSDTSFAPQALVTRGMIVTIIGRLANANLSGYANQNPFADVPSGQYYTAYAAWAKANAIVNGVSAASFAPDAPVTRQDLAVILMNYARFAGKPLAVKRIYGGFADSAEIAGYAQASVATVYQAGIMSGKPGNLFDPKGIATRAEVAAILRRFIEASQ